ncbi:MAG: S49 family peptidase [Alphaproteobacteria bacterium]|nr:S49 family peptidase [Alphaproteobacteria bacterium]
MRFPHLAQRLFNVPLAIHPRKAEIVMAALSERLGVTHLFRPDGTAVDMSPQMFFDKDDADSAVSENIRGYETLEGAAIIQIEGTLVNKLGTLHPYSGMTGYDGIRQNFLTALADPAVKSIVLDIDSPGGEVAGCFDLVDTIYNARGEKPIWAILNENAFSAAYAIASAADHITVPRTGGVGSIGVITMHVDWSKALAGAGIKVTFITFGDRKADGHPEIPLSEEAKESIQQDIDAMGELFVATVARNRGLSAQDVRDQQARCFTGADGVAAGLADEISAPDAAFRQLLDEADQL